MRTQRRLAMLATVGAMLVATAGVLLSPGVASATPGHGYQNPGGGHGDNNPGGGYGNNNPGGGHGSGTNTNYPYPPGPPSLTVSSGTVKAGKSVRVTGRDFGPNELVVVRVRYRPSVRFWFARHGIVIQQTATWTDNKGRFSTYAHSFLPGSLSITATGLQSRKSASANVRVLPRRGSHGGGMWWGAGATGGDTSAGETTTTPVSLNTGPTQRPDGAGQLFLVALTIAALAGSSLLTRQLIRRRRTTA